MPDNDLTGKMNDDEALKRMLKDKSKEELVDLILRTEGFGLHGTGDLSFNPGSIPFDMQKSAQSSVKIENYRKLPLNPTPLPKGKKHVTWRFELVPATPGLEPLGIELQGDVIVGRAVSDYRPDFDLNDLLGSEIPPRMGVSRRHAVLRPGESGVTLVDLASKNGTYVNGTRLTPGKAFQLEDGLVISFGGVHFRLHRAFKVKFGALSEDEDTKPHTPPASNT